MKQNPAVEVQKKYLDILREYNLLELALMRKLPKHVENSARKAAILSVPGVKSNDDFTQVLATAEEHAEAQRELDEYLKHYKLIKEAEMIIRAKPIRYFEKGKKYFVQSGSFMGRAVVYKGTDVECFGVPWHDYFSYPPSESFLFRVQKDRLELNTPVLVCLIDGREFLFEASELGVQVK